MLARQQHGVNMRDSRGTAMTKYSQYTLNQVAGFDGQILAQELVYNQQDFWNFQWASVVSTNSGWTQNTYPVDLTGATIDAQILRRQIVGLKNGRTGLDFTIMDYPIEPVVATVTATDATSDALTCASTALLFEDKPVYFKGTVFGNIVEGTTYYVKTIVNSTSFTVSTSSGGSVFPLATATGSMTANTLSPTPVNLPISNIVAADGSFTMTINDDTWDVIAGDPELDINASDPVCFTGRVKISFPAVGTQPPYDEFVFLLFLITSDGVVN